MADEFKTYRANAEGYDGDKIRVEGEVFTTNIPQGSWMDLLDKDGNVVERPKHTPAPAKGDVVGKGDASAADFQKALDARDADIAALRAEVEQLKAGAAAAGDAGQAGQPDPGPLDQSIPDLTAYLETVGDVGAVDALIAAEKGGKSRSGALEALEARKAALQGS